MEIELTGGFVATTKGSRAGIGVIIAQGEPLKGELYGSKTSIEINGNFDTGVSRFHE
jgi:phosphate-selective porin